jgi:tetratricopeptide (TPR) repeat protein
MVLVVQGIYLSKVKKSDESIAAYRKALAIDESLIEAHYNLGLELAATGQLAESNRHAQIAYRGGYPLPGLRNRLERLGAWNPTTASVPSKPQNSSAAP